MSVPANGWGGGERRDRAAAQGLARQSGASARFATDAEIASARWSYEPGAPTLLLGHHAARYVGLARDDRHAMVVGGSRGGKGVSLIIPWLCTWPGSGSIICLDPKAELARMTARVRRELHGQRVLILDPFAISGLPQDSYNFLDGIDLASPHVVADLQLLTESLIVSSSSSTDGDHWAGGARELVMALCLYAKLYFHRPTLVTVYDLLSGKHGTVLGSMDAPSDVFGVMLESDALSGALKSMGVRFLEISSREQSSIVSTARRQLAWLEGLNNADAAMTRVCQSSDFTLADLKRESVCVFLILPASYMHAYRPWLRAIINQTMTALEHTPSRPGAAPVLVLLDEFATLGHLSSLEKAAGLLAGSGIKLVPVVQDLNQLKSVYGDRWPTFIGNSGVTIWLAPGGDEMTLDYLSKRLGVTQYYETQQPGGDFTSRASSGLLRGGGQWITAPLMYPHEIEQILSRQSGRLLALSPGSPPLILNRVDIRHGFAREWIDG